MTTSLSSSYDTHDLLKTIDHPADDISSHRPLASRRVHRHMTTPTRKPLVTPGVELPSLATRCPNDTIVSWLVITEDRQPTYRCSIPILLTAQIRILTTSLASVTTAPTTILISPQSHTSPQLAPAPPAICPPHLPQLSLQFSRNSLRYLGASPRYPLSNFNQSTTTTTLCPPNPLARFITVCLHSSICHIPTSTSLSSLDHASFH